MLDLLRIFGASAIGLIGGFGYATVVGMRKRRGFGR